MGFAVGPLRTAPNVYRVIALGSTNLATIKAGPGHVAGWQLHNPSAAVKYVKLYNKASNPTLAADTPVWTIGVPAGATRDLDLRQGADDPGVHFSDGIAIAMVALAADTDATALTAGDIIAHVIWV